MKVHRKSAWWAAALLATFSLLVASTAAHAQEPAAKPPGDRNPMRTATAEGVTRTAPPRDVVKVPADRQRQQPTNADPTKPETARDTDDMKPESARDEQTMVPETARDDQKMTPETAHDE